MEELTWCGITYSRDGNYIDPNGFVSRSDMCILGVPYDGGRSAAGGQDAAPQAVRLLETFDSWHDPLLGDLTTVKMVDAGDLGIDHRAAALSLISEGGNIAGIWENTDLLLAVGGDHSITSVLLETAVWLKKKKLNVIHIDAHADTWEPSDVWQTGLPTHDTWVTHSQEHNHIAHLWQLGVRELTSPNDTPDKWPNRTIFVGDVSRTQLFGLTGRYNQQHKDEEVYLSVDVDVVDPAFCPGVAYPVPGGWTPQALLETIEILVAELPVIGVDIVETTPSLDHDELSVRLAHRSVLAAVKGLKRRQAAKA